MVSLMSGVVKRCKNVFALEKPIVRENLLHRSTGAQ